jgi:hypothetical protein
MNGHVCNDNIVQGYEAIAKVPSACYTRRVDKPVEIGNVTLRNEFKHLFI